VAAIALRQVSKVFSTGQTAARDITLDIADGELLVLVGPSGSGKSTVLRLIAGLETPTAGEVLIGNRDVTAVAPQHRDLAMVFQSYALYPHKTVRENLAFPLRVRRSTASQIDDRVRQAAAALGIETLLERKPAQLSGGQRQRVALGRAIVREPQAFLLDEPLSNLDPQMRVAARAELAILHRRLGATMVYVTHDQEEAMTLGTRVAVMREGTIEQVARPLDLFRRPANAFVAGFIGAPAMNFVRGTILPHGAGSLRLASPAFTIDEVLARKERPDGAISHDTDAVTPGEVLLGVRPHDIDLTPPGEGHGVGRVEIVELLGSTSVIHLRVDGVPDSLLRVVVSSDATVAINEQVGFHIPVDRLHLFDERTGRRLDTILSI
jgi:multiple sugar transport system ATP-binding protein